MSNSILLSIIIVAYKNWTVLNNTLLSIEKYNDLGENLEVIVVDNSPENERIGKYLPQDLKYTMKYIESNNRGFGAGNNDDEKIAAGKYIGFINPDIVFIEPIFRKVIEKFQSNEHVGMIGTKLLNKDRKWAFSFYYDYRASFFHKQSIKICNKFDLFHENKMYIAGADMFVRKDLFEKAGRFDENIFMYYEEPDLTRRLRKIDQSCEIIYLKDCSMIHLERQSSGSNDKMINEEIKSCIYYGRKYDLDYKKKVKEDLKYIKFKRNIAALLKRDCKSYDHTISCYESCIKKEYQI